MWAGAVVTILVEVLVIAVVVDVWVGTLAGVLADVVFGFEFGFGVVLVAVNANVLEALSLIVPTRVDKLRVEKFSC